MQKRNLIADAFFEGISAFSEQSGAVGFDSSAEYSGGRRKKGELTKMICTARYTDYDIEYVYTASGGLNFCSVFNFRVILDRRIPQIKLSPYDLMYKLDETDFTCYTYSYIESPERMSRLIKELTPRLYEFLEKLDSLCRRKADLDDVFNKFSDTVNTYYGRDIFRISDDDDGEFESFMDSYYMVDDSFYVSKPYAQFLSGDYNSAYNGMRRIKGKSYYQIRLMSFIASLDHKYEATPEGCNTTADAVYSGKTQVLRTILSSLLMIIPCAAFLIGLHYLSSAIIYRGAIWSDAWFVLNAVRYISSSVLPAFALSWYVKGLTLPLFKSDRRKYLSALDKISANTRRSGFYFTITCAASLILVVTVVLTANSYAAFYDDGLRLPSQSEFYKSENYVYSDVEKLVHAEGAYNINGKFIPGEQYIIVMKNGDKYNLSYEAANNIIAEKIVPVLKEKGVTIVTVHDADDIDFVP